MWENFNKEFPNACDILLRYSSVRLNLDELVSLIPLLKPRLYSICTCPKVHGRKVKFVYLPREWCLPMGRTVKGLTTSYLSRLLPKKGKVDMMWC